MRSINSVTQQDFEPSDDEGDEIEEAAAYAAALKSSSSSSSSSSKKRKGGVGGEEGRHTKSLYKLGSKKGGPRVEIEYEHEVEGDTAEVSTMRTG